jgi:spore germination protein KC
MNKKSGIAISFALLSVLTGCWDRAELPEKGFVMGIAIDQTEEGRYTLTTQIFKPAQAVGGKGNETSYINVTTEDLSISKAIRDMPLHLGRKLQWSHMRVILVGDKLAKSRKIADILEFFYRDHEPRLTAPIMITEGIAKDYLQIKPYIENTIAQQYLESERSSASSNAKAVKANLLELGLQMKSPVGNALLPYVSVHKNERLHEISVAGAAMFKKGNYIGTLDSDLVEGLHMLMNKYVSGMTQIPCNPHSETAPMESVEILTMHSKMQPELGKHPLKVRYQIRVDTALSELTCSKIENAKEEKAFVDKVREAIKKQLTATTERLTKIKFDALGLGNAVYRKHPDLWKKWKNDWDQMFAETEFDFDIEVRVRNGGTTIDKPALKKPE